MKCVRKTFFAAAGLLATALAQPLPSMACAACYGASDSPLAQGMNWGIVFLLGVVGSVLAGISLFFVQISRRSAAVKSKSSHELSAAKE